jgi:hypothetical protein
LSAKIFPFLQLDSSRHNYLRGNNVRTNRLQNSLVPNYLTATIVSVLLSLTTYVGTANSQSADPKHPAPLQPGDNIGVISNIVQIPHYYYVAIGPGKGSLTVDFSVNGFPGSGGQIRVTLLSKGRKDYSVVVKSTQDLYSSNAAQPSQVTIPFDSKERQVVLRIDPPTAGLLVASGRYNVKVTGTVRFAPLDSSQAQVVGVYRVGNRFGNDESNKLIKLVADGRILSETGTTGSWSLFDPSSKTYVLELAGKRESLIFWPAVGFSVSDSENPTLRLVR